MSPESISYNAIAHCLLNGLELNKAEDARCWEKLATLVSRNNPLTGTLNCTNTNVAHVSHQVIMARSSRTTVETARQILE